jgi:hypothetical protein
MMNTHRNYTYSAFKTIKLILFTGLFMKIILLFILAMTSISAAAGGVSTAATPTGIDIDRSGGFMVYGDFGNVGGCTTTNQIYVQSTHPQYNQIYSTVLAAFMSGKKIFAYIQACTPVGWYSVDSVTYNTLTPNSMLYLRN